MEAFEDYAHRKSLEAGVLRSMPLVPFPATPPNLPGLVRDKLAIFRERCTSSTFARFPETNWTDSRDFRVGDHRFTYSYQRFDLDVEAPPIYPCVAPELSPQTSYFTCSGMAALTAAFSALDRLLTKPVGFWSQADAYFETQHLARAYTRNLSPVVAGFERLAEEAYAAGSKAIIHVDSISASLDGLARAASHGCVLMGLFDTTCYPRADHRIAQIVDTFAQRGLPTLLVRSHLKLDSLGLECGRLGSLTLCEPSGCAAEARPAVEGLRRLIPDAIRSLGLGAEAGNFFPVFDTAQFMELSSARSIRTAENAEFLANLLDGSLPCELGVRRYQHGQFLTLHHPAWTDARAAKVQVGEVVAAYRAAGGAAAEANSFGFDFTALSDVMDMSSQRFALRIAPSDEPSECMKLLAERIISVTSVASLS